MLLHNSDVIANGNPVLNHFWVTLVDHTACSALPQASCPFSCVILLYFKPGLFRHFLAVDKQPLVEMLIWKDFHAKLGPFGVRAFLSSNFCELSQLSSNFRAYLLLMAVKIFTTSYQKMHIFLFMPDDEH